MPADLTLPELGPFGAGPFFALENVPLENVTSRGEVAEFSYNSAFGHLGGHQIELMEIDQLSPARLADRVSGPRPRLHHLAWAVPPSSVEQVREGLETHGAPCYLQPNLDEIDLSFHYSPASLGHDVEIHADVKGLQRFFTMFREAAENWDGSDPIRQSAKPAGRGREIALNRAEGVDGSSPSEGFVDAACVRPLST